MPEIEVIPSSVWGCEGEKTSAYVCQAEKLTSGRLVVSSSLTLVGPNATLVKGEVEATIRGLKVQLDGSLKLPDQS